MGLLVGSIATLPFGWELPNAAASFLGAAVGVAGAVSAGLWAANEKQRKEELRSSEARGDIAALIASAITPEIANARKVLAFIADKLDEEIKMADLGDVSFVASTLETLTIDTTMCERFVSRLEAFGTQAAELVEAIGALFDINSAYPRLGKIVRSGDWVKTGPIVKNRAYLARFYASNLVAALDVLKQHHHRGNNAVLWAAWTSE